MLDVIYEDNQIIVVNKPHNVPSQADSSQDDDMLTIVKNYIKDKANKPGNVFLGLVHRLDRPTGGIMVFAKTSKSASRLSQSIRNGEMVKNYVAVVEGVVKESKDKLTHYLKKNEKTNIVSVVGQAVEGAKYAELYYDVVNQKRETTLIKVNLITGRSHQIRSQFSYIGNPIKNDLKYGSPTQGRLMLWAYELQFEHPTTKQKMKFKLMPENVGYWSLYENELLKLSL